MNRRRLDIVILLRYWWEFKTTLAGKVTAVSILVTGFAAMVSLEIPVYQLLFAQSFLVLVVFAAAWCARPAMETLWRLPEKAVAGQPVNVACRVTNRSRFWARAIGMGAARLPMGIKMEHDASSLDTVAPGKDAEASFRLRPLRRGIYSWPRLMVYTQYPFGLFRTRVRGEKNLPHAKLIVYPRFRPLTSIDVPINARYQPGGIALSSSVGESPEYIGNREYRPGDSTRHFDHRAWARLSTPAVREYQEEYYCRVALVLDTFVPGRRKAGPEGYPELEAAISLAAAVADALGRGEYIIDIFAAGPELYVFRAGRGTAHFENVLEILACVDACHVNPFRKITPALIDELANISSVICVFLDWDAERARLVQSAAEAGSSVKVAVVREGPLTLPYASAPVGSVAQYSPNAIRAGSVESL